MEVLFRRQVGGSDLCPGRSLKGLPMDPKIDLAAFLTHVPAHGAEGQAVDETGTLMPVWPEHQSFDVTPPCQVIGRHASSFPEGEFS